MIFAVATLLLVAIVGAVRGADQGCCIPDQWQGFQGSESGYSGPNTRFVAKNVQIFYDAANSRVAANSTIYGYNGTKHYFVVNRNDKQCVGTKLGEDLKVDVCGKGKMYIVDLDTNKCYIQDKLFQKFCIPDKAKFMGKFTFGAGNDTLEGKSFAVDIAEKPEDSVVAWITVTARDCVPVGVSSYGHFKEVGFMETSGYSNIKLSIDDPSVFDVPAQCQKNASTTALPEGIRDIHSVFTF